MSQSVFEIPLSPTPQVLSVVLAGVTYQLTIRWCDPSQSWIMDIADASGNPLLSGIPLITGVDLLSQLGYVGIAGSLIVQTDNNPLAVPTFTNLGTTGHLYFLPD